MPIAKGGFKENLSYFTSKDIEPGALVTVPVRKKIIPAIVVSSQELRTAKTDLRRADFSLKSIKTVRAEKFLLPKFMEACKEMANYFLAPVGSIVKDLVPQIILEDPATSNAGRTESGIDANKYHEVILFQGDREERIQYYKSIIREEFARNRSVFICLPTAADIENIFSELQRGIEKYAIIMHSGIKKKKIKELWSFALREQHPLLIAATRSFLSLPRENIGTLIIDKESSPFYKLQNGPYLDVRKAAELIAQKKEIRLIFGDVVLRVETSYRNKFASGRRIFSEIEQAVASEDEIRKKIGEVLGNPPTGGEKIILFANRRGYSPITICKDCFRPIMCEKCHSPLVLHKRENPPVGKSWLCHKCLKEIIVPERCPYCKSWKLEEYGAGIRKTADEIKKLFPQTKLFVMDSDAVKTEKQGKEIADGFLAAPGLARAAEGAILVGTEIIFSYIHQPVDMVVAASVDPLFTLPDFRINEKIFQLLIKLKSLAKKKFYIQTKMPEQKVFEEAMRGNISGFYRAEIESRKESSYPPFSLLIKITGENKNKPKLKKDMDELEKRLAKWNPISYSAFTPKIKDKYIWNILLKIGPETWPTGQKELREILSSLPPAWKINVDPESLL